MAAEYLEDDESDVINIKASSDIFLGIEEKTYTDPFMSKPEDVKKLSGLSTNFRKKLARTDFTKVLQGQGSATTQIVEPFMINGYRILDVVQPPYNQDYLAKIYEISSPHYAAVNAKVANIVGLGYDFVESEATKERLADIDDEKQLERARRKLERIKIQINSWLEACNEEETFVETLSRVWKDYEVTGNGYLEIGRKNTGEIGYIGHVPSASVRVRRLRDGFVQIIGNQSVFFRNYGDTQTVNPVTADARPNEIIHFKNYTPTNNYYGVPDIIASKNAMAGNEFAARFNLDYFENKAVPRYIITVKGAKLSNDAERKLLEFFQTGLKGKNHRSLYIPLPADSQDSKVEFKMEAVENGIQDGSFNTYRVSNRDEILISHRVPINKVGTPTGVSLANARDADKTFKEQVCRPAQRNIEKKLGKIIAEKTDIFMIKFNELTLTDEDTQSKIDERYLRMQVLVPNEIRARMGLQGIPGGDDVVVLNAKAAAEQNTQASGNRSRDRERQGNQPDLSGEGRNEQGAGRQVQ
jgi:PBSX family phage portal protein